MVLNKYQFCEKFFYGDGKKFIFGINDYADAISRVVDIDGYVDQYTEERSHNGKPILKLEDIPKESLVVSSVTNSRPKTALQKISAAGIKNAIDYFSFAEASKGLVPQLSCISDMRKDFRSNEQSYRMVRSLLADSESLETYDNIMDFRLNAEISSLDKFSFRIDKQYFEPFLGLSAGEVFVDGGGYDGFTTLGFAKICPGYSSVHFFEPSENSLEKARVNLRSLKKISFYQLGLYDIPAVLKFDSADGSASRITDSGEEIIEVDSLDNSVSEKVTFIKLDLEGAEMAALRGMKSHILNDHPKLAVAVYHKPSDFREVPDYILGLRSDYDVFLRHYTEGWSETIMFFIPK